MISYPYLKQRSLSKLGIVICGGKRDRIRPFHESGFFRHLSEEAKNSDIQVIVFNPKKVNWKHRTVEGYVLAPDHKWDLGTYPLPTLIYDRCYYASSKHYLSYKPYLSKISEDPTIRLLGKPLSGKIQTYSILKLNQELIPHLPETILYSSPQNVFNYLNRYSNALIKPNGGSHGRGVVAILRKANGYLLKGRNKKNDSFQQFLPSDQKLQEWVPKFIGATRYVVQPYLSLSTPEGYPFDVRILIQKNEHKQWTTTGMAVRAGKINTITSNLHGGGKAYKLHPFLDQSYSATQVEKIQHQIQKITSIAPSFIEQHHGILVELGLDIGIDRSGHVWLLEVNSKPGRTVFLKIGDLETRKRSIELPIRYARALLAGQ